MTIYSKHDQPVKGCDVPVLDEAVDDAQLSATASRIRALTLEQVLAQGGGYLGQACSSAEILATLFGHVLRLGPSLGPAVPSPFAGVPGSPTESPTGGLYLGAHRADLDRFILSPSHYAMALYAALIADGRLDERSLAQFNVDGSTLEMIGAEHSPGCELTTGSFAQALSQAAGIAWARRRAGDTGRVWVFLSDGEMQEGQTWEALQFIVHHELDNIRIVVDVNGQQVDGRMEDVMGIHPLDSRFTAFGADVLSVDGHNVRALAAAFDREPKGKPLVVLANTHPTTGIPSLRERGSRLHYIRVLDESNARVLAAELDELQLEGMNR